MHSTGCSETLSFFPTIENGAKFSSRYLLPDDLHFAVTV